MKRGLLTLKNVYFEKLNQMLWQLGALVGEVNADVFYAKIEAQLSPNARLQVLPDGGDDFQEVNIQTALALAPCRVFFETGFDWQCADMPQAPLEMSLHIEKRKTRYGDYMATYDWHVQPLGADYIMDIYPIPLVENLLAVKKIVAPILGVTGSYLWELLRKNYILNGEWTVGTVAEAVLGKDLVFPEVAIGEGHVRLDISEVLNHPRCPLIYRKVPVDFFSNGEALKQLSQLAQEETAPCKWDFYQGGELVKGNFCGLRHYLEQIFTRLCQDAAVGKHAFGYSNGQLYFCTGLLSREHKGYIYGVCGALDEQHLFHSVEWVEEKDLLEANLIGGLPAPANWTREPEALICQREKLIGLESRINLEHILFHDAHAERFSPNFFVQRAGRKVFNSTQARICLLAALEKACQKAQMNYRYVIPGYYQGRITLQLPLLLDGSEHANAFLVLVENEDGVYEAPTLLTPSMAYYNARAITPQETAVWEDCFFAEICFQQMSMK